MERKRVSSLQIEEDLGFHETSWRVARVTLTLLIAVMLATAIGAFGGGPLSHARALDSTGANRVEFERLLRFGASTRLRIHLGPARDGVATFTLDRVFVEAYQILRITPEPESASLIQEGVAYRFAVEPGSDAEVLLELQPARRWLVRGTIRAGDAPLTLTQFVFP